MSRLSLGIRSLSFGSIPRQAQQNGGLQYQNSVNCRKTARTKERYLQLIFRYSGRRKLIMLILAVFAVIALCTGIFNTRREVASESSFGGFEGWLDSKISQNIPTVCPESGGYSLYESNYSTVNAVQTPPLLSHQCKNFALPPPPPSGSRRIGPRPCPVCYTPVEQAMASMPRYPSPSPVLQHLTYFQVENSIKTESRGGSEFGGYPSLEQRNVSFNIDESMTVHCGFIKGCRAGAGTGFDIDAADLMDMDEHHEIIVASAIFGNYDILQQPRNVSEVARKNIPFYMFVDEETEAYLKNSSLLDSSKRVGIWRIIVVHNVPYADPRRNGKVPKLLLHRLFPNVRFSIWIDGKLQLVADPYQILERFLWRENATFAISRHYKRFDVFVEAEANKAAAKYDNSSIDYQIDFYRQEGLTPYTRAKLPITSDVPEGCVIIREHIPITNLFTCLWFNEVDRFTSRDQLSFSTVRDKIMAKTNWTISMFLDCERRNFVVQAYHRDLLERMPPPIIPKPRSPAKLRIYPPPVVHPPAKKSPIKRSKGGKKSGSKTKRHRKVDAGVREN